jgi:hypothetical protein
VILDIVSDYGLPTLLGCIAWMSLFSLAIVWISGTMDED